MNRRHFLSSFILPSLLYRLQAARGEPDIQFDAADRILTQAVQHHQVAGASFSIRHRGTTRIRHYGTARSGSPIYLLASITKPFSATGLMTLADANELKLTDPLSRFIPEFDGEGRETITIEDCLTHRSGLPDQLPENTELRRRHAPLAAFVEKAIRTPLRFLPRKQYGYSSMGILLLSEVARRITRQPFPAWLRERVFQPLGMPHSALGLDPLQLNQTMKCQVEQAAPESGVGAASARNWDWNSPYWRRLGAPWGGAHGSVEDVTRFLDEFLHPRAKLLRPDTMLRMTRNQNPPGMTPRGLGFALSPQLGPRQDRAVFGHTGSTGTLCWADRKTDTICVVLTTLPARAASPHPRDLASQALADALFPQGATP